VLLCSGGSGGLRARLVRSPRRRRKRLRTFASVLIIFAVLLAAAGTAIYLAGGAWERQFRSFVASVTHDIQLPAITQSFVQTAQHVAANAVWQCAALTALLALT